MSAWFFYLFGKAERVVRMGMLGEGELYFAERAGGAWLAVGILALWGTRRHLRDVIRNCLMTKKVFDDSNEPMPYRVAVVGIIFGTIGLTLFSIKAGMSLGGVLGFIVILFSWHSALRVYAPNSVHHHTRSSPSIPLV